MLAARGLFDGKDIKLLDNVNIKNPQEVIITFLGDENEMLLKGIPKLAEIGGSFDFLNDPEEDIYTDEDLKEKY